MLGRLSFLALFIILFGACVPIAPAAFEPTLQPLPAAAIATSIPLPLSRDHLRVTILYDLSSTDKRLHAGAGFAALVEVAGHTLLFDTGPDIDHALEDNMRELNVDAQSIEAVILSHKHSDHIGGLPALLDTGIRPTVYVPYTFSRDLKESISAQTNLVTITDTLEILPGVHVVIASDEAALSTEAELVAETPDGSVILVGCAHPGVVRMVTEAQKVVPGEVTLLAGGFHLTVPDKSLPAELRALEPVMNY